MNRVIVATVLGVTAACSPATPGATPADASPLSDYLLA